MFFILEVYSRDSFQSTLLSFSGAATDIVDAIIKGANLGNKRTIWWGDRE